MIKILKVGASREQTREKSDHVRGVVEGILKGIMIRVIHIYASSQKNLIIGHPKVFA